MSFRYVAQGGGDLVVVVFEGEITPEEEQKALLEVAADPAVAPDSKVLVDRRRATMTVGPEHVRPHIALAREVFETTGKPRMALVAPRDYDFAMARMLELTAGDDLPHELRIFRSLEEACDWLGVDPGAIVWPAGES